MFNLKTVCSVLMALLMFAGAGIAQNKSAAKPRTKHVTRGTEDFAAEMQKLRGTWVEEFNAGHADKVAALYAPEAVLMRWDGSVHGYDSILAEPCKNPSARARMIMSSTACTRSDLEISGMTQEVTTWLFATA